MSNESGREPVFVQSYPGQAHPGDADYDVTADGTRCLMIKVDQQAAPVHANVVLDWLSTLRSGRK